MPCSAERHRVYIDCNTTHFQSEIKMGIVLGIVTISHQKKRLTEISQPLDFIGARGRNRTGT